MAFVMNFKSSIGVEFENSYAMIYKIGGSKDELSFQVYWYVNEAFRHEKVRYIEIKNYKFNPSVAEGSLNFIKQGYEYLKTLDEFETAIDVI